MDLLKTGIGIGKTIKNVARMREILTVFWRNGFDEFIIKSNLHSKIPGFVLPKKRIQSSLDESMDNETIYDSVGFRLRKSFEELGPSFIKLGQLLGTREDILDQALINELKKLQNSAHGVEFAIIKKELEESLGQKIEDVFDDFDPVAIGTASIGIVHKAKLKTGEEVVVKVKRPGIDKLLASDFEIISFLIGQLEKVSDDIKYLGVSRAIDDFFKSIQLELNFLIEAQNGSKLKKNLEKIDEEKLITIPVVYDEYTTDSVLVMEKLNGRAFIDIANIREEDPEIEEKLIKCVKLFIHTILADGYFHADLHGGNFFLLPDKQIGLIDFGLMGSLSRKNRSNLVAILFAIVTNNYENLVYEFLDVADYETIPNHEVLVRDIQDALTPFIGLSVQQTDVTKMTNSIVTTLSKHQMYLPREWFIIFRALMTLDGVGKQIQIDLNIFEIIDSEIHGIMEELLSKESIIEDAMWIGRDTLSSLRIIPRHIRWVLKEFARKKYRLDIQITGVQREMKLISKALYFLGMIFLSSVLIFSGVFLVKDVNVSSWEDIPLLVWSFWGLGTLSFFRASSFIRNK